MDWRGRCVNARFPTSWRIPAEPYVAVLSKKITEISERAVSVNCCAYARSEVGGHPDHVADRTRIGKTIGIEGVRSVRRPVVAIVLVSSEEIALAVARKTSVKSGINAACESGAGKMPCRELR